MEEIMQSRLDKIESIQEIHLNNCNLRYESCEYIANMIEKKGSFEIKEANFSGIFNDDDIDTDEINSALKILLEAITDEKSVKVVNLSDNKIDDSMAFTLSDSFASIVSSKLVALTLDNNFMRE